MRSSLTESLVITAVACIAIAAATPVKLDKPEASPSVDHGSSIVNADLHPNRPSSSSLRDMFSHNTDSALDIGLNSQPLLHDAASSSSSVWSFPQFSPVLYPLPTVRTDIVDSFLRRRFELTSNVPLQHTLTPTERSATFSMAEQHLQQRTTWLHAVVDEPQSNLHYRKQLYVASPLVGLDWRSVVGLPVSKENAHWLPVVFYKLDLDRTRPNHLKLAGIELVKDSEEAKRFIRGWDSSDTFSEIGKLFGKVVDHGPYHMKFV
ncbi:hypothetical protein NDA16_002404 [Ustilago loliicola]|nr:hypothetical protein NDA16_002404 [Ustilago loliicola]